MFDGFEINSKIEEQKNMDDLFKTEAELDSKEELNPNIVTFKRFYEELGKIQWSHGVDATSKATGQFETELKEAMDIQLQEMVKMFERRTDEKLDILNENPSDETQQKVTKMNKEFYKIVSHAKN